MTALVCSHFGQRQAGRVQGIDLMSQTAAVAMPLLLVLEVAHEQILRV